MIFVSWLIFIFFCAECDINLRGVCKSMRPLYQHSTTEFRCFNDSKRIDSTQINDNYCDCDDGSDEPGTSACEHGVFCCRNAYYRSKFIPASRVDDRICDCCDGSDEAEGHCPNTCKLLFEKEFKKLKDEFNKIEHAKHECDEYLNSKKYSPQYYHDQIDFHNKEKAQFEAKYSELADLRQKAANMFSMMKADYTDKHSNELEQKKKDYYTMVINELYYLLDSNNDTLLDKNEFHYLLKRLDEENLPKEGFIQKLMQNHTFIDKLKSIFTDAYPYSLEKEQRDYNVSNEAFNSYDVDNDEYDHENEVDDTAELDKDDGPVSDENESEVKAHFPGWDSPFEINKTKDQSDGKLPNENIVTIPYETWKNVSNLLKDISSKVFQVDFPPEIIEKEEEFKNIDFEFSKLNQQIQHITKHIDILKSFDSIDFGPKRIFSLLFHDCYLFNDTNSHYTYEVCPFKYIKQLENNKNTTIGYWNKWIHDDINNPSYKTMHYNLGDSCYNNNDRRSNLHLKCGKENKVISIEENSICQYEVQFETVAACYQVPTPSLNESVYHDEL